MKVLWFYIKFFLKGCYVNNFRNLNFSQGTWIGKSVSIFFEKPAHERQSIYLGHNVKIGHFSDLYVGRDNAIIIKDYTTLNTNCKIAGDVTIERYCLLSANILISSGNHYATKFPHLLIRQQDEIVLSSPEGIREHSKPVHIEEDVWIGFGVYIKHGVTIGRGAVVGANSVVLSDIPPYEIVGGTPARKIKARLDFKPKHFITASREEDLPYFYRGFDHYHVNDTNPSREMGILSYETSAIAIPMVISQTIACKGFLLHSGSISIRVSLDGIDCGTYTVQANFELEIKANNTSGVKKNISNYSFLTFDVPDNKSLCFGINSIKLVEPL